MEKNNNKKRFADGVKETNANDFEYHVKNDCVYIDKYYGTRGFYISIPKYIDDKLVVGIGCNAFSDSGIVGLIIPDTVTEVDQQCCERCRLSTITWNNSKVDHVADFAYGVLQFDWASEDVLLNPVEVIGKSNDSKYNYYNCLDIKKEGVSDIVNLNGYLFYRLNDAIYLINYIGIETKLVLPESFDGEPYHIFDLAFYNKKQVTSIKLPNNVISIGNEAFLGCENLTNINIPESVEYCGKLIFDRCYKLQYNIYDNACYLGNEKSRYLYLDKLNVRDDFKSQKKLTSLIINEECKFIRSGYQLYSGAPEEISITEIINQSSMKDERVKDSIGRYALEVKPKGSSSGIVKIDDYLFQRYDGTNYLVRYIGDETNLVLPESFNGESYVVRSQAFLDTRIHSIVFSNGVTAIEDWAIDDAYYLRKIIIPENVKEIGDRAFGDYLLHKECIIVNKSKAKISNVPKEVPEYEFLDDHDVKSNFFNEKDADTNYVRVVDVHEKEEDEIDDLFDKDLIKEEI